MGFCLPNQDFGYTTYKNIWLSKCCSDVLSMCGQGMQQMERDLFITNLTNGLLIKTF